MLSGWILLITTSLRTRYGVHAGFKTFEIKFFCSFLYFSVHFRLISEVLQFRFIVKVRFFLQDLKGIAEVFKQLQLRFPHQRVMLVTTEKVRPLQF